ncbi:MAG TPA: DUF192 domain-containing protein [Bryobacteraceae bacterium]
MKRLYVLAAALLVCSCGPQTDAGNLNITEVTFPNGKTVTAETMLRDVDQMRGMMFRDSLAKDRGMLFVHAAEGKHPYWMYQVRIPLDIVWMDQQRRIVEIAANTPPCPSKEAHECPSFGGRENARYVLELAGGSAAGYGLKAGDTLRF